MASNLSQYEDAYQKAYKANEAIKQQGLTILDAAIERYQPGGQFGKGAMAEYEMGKEKSLATGMQSLIGAGLSNTTVAAGMPLAYEQEVGTPFKLQLEDMRMGRLTDAEMKKVGFLERIQNNYPDPGMFAEMQAKGSSGGGVTYQKSNFLDTWGAPDPAVSARNAAAKIKSDLLTQQTNERNAAAQAKRSALRTNNNKSTGSSTPSMSDADYQALLEKNLGFTVAPTTMTGPQQQTTGSYQKKETSSYNPFNYTGNY
jgi:hypothetical protein